MDIIDTLIQTRIFITPLGVFYEGQVLYRYLWCNGKLYYEDEVILEKFIFHYKTGSPKLYCKIFLKDSTRKTRNYYTINSEQLGVLYKIKKWLNIKVKSVVN